MFVDFGYAPWSARWRGRRGEVAITPRPAGRAFDENEGVLFAREGVALPW